MTSNEIRKKFLGFFEKNGHSILPSASLIPENDPSALFTTAGVQPLVPYILQGSHPKGNRLASVQKCLRTTDIDDIGDKMHATFFEMMGNWSIGDYFKEDAIKWSFDLLTKEFKLDPKRLYVTVFEGDQNAPKDVESIEIWSQIFKEAGLNPESRIFPLSAKSNWWPQPKSKDSYSGPCGPSTEMFYDSEGNLGDLTLEEFIKADEDQVVVEIWNDVFMEYKKESGQVTGKLPKQNVDTGSGLERLLTVLQEKDNIFETDIFEDLVSQTKKLTDSIRSARIVADHLRSAVFIISDGVIPSNTDRGYVLRRLLRRAVFHTTQKSLDSGDISTLVNSVADTYESSYPELKLKIGIIKTEIEKELEKFQETIQKGLREFEKLKNVDGKQAFVLFSTYGFPLELTLELAKEKGIKVNVEEFQKELAEHQTKSRTASAGKFKGGLGGHSEREIQYHTATHLLNAALREVLGYHVMQKGSNINPDRLRFDFTHTEKLTDEEKQKIEDLVNEKIKARLDVTKVEMSPEEAKERGAIGVFADKYGEVVNVYSIGDFSKEICGGPHISNTSELGHFKIKKEEASSAGVRRIKAVLE